MSAVLAPTPSPESRPLSGPKILLYGDGGTGKTYSLGTLGDWCAAHGKELFALFTENSAETFLGYWRDRGKEIPECVHWHQALTKAVGLSRIMEGAKRVGELSYEMLTKTQDAQRSGENNAFLKILAACSNFPDDRTGKTFGAVDSWGLDKVFILDSLTELGNAAAKMVIGSKPTMAPPEYGVAQNNLMNFLRLLTQATQCTVVVTGHAAREKNELTGAIGTTVSTGGIGTAILSQIPTLFSDMIYAVREGNEFTWDTAAYGVVSKTRSLGYKSKIKPDFGQIMDLWLKRGGK